MVLHHYLITHVQLIANSVELVSYYEHNYDSQSWHPDHRVVAGLKCEQNLDYIYDCSYVY